MEAADGEARGDRVATMAPASRTSRSSGSSTSSSGGGATSVSGTGLGLYISRQIVNAHGGRIWAESTPGEGAAFRFVLPLDGAGSDGT